jgi:hypothetical protein
LKITILGVWGKKKRERDSARRAIGQGVSSHFSAFRKLFSSLRPKNFHMGFTYICYIASSFDASVNILLPLRSMTFGDEIVYQKS